MADQDCIECGKCTKSKPCVTCKKWTCKHTSVGNGSARCNVCNARKAGMDCMKNAKSAVNLLRTTVDAAKEMMG